MSIEKLTCTNCGAVVNIEDDSDAVSCPYCGTEINLKEDNGPVEETKEQSEDIATLSEEAPNEGDDQEQEDIEKEIEELTAAYKKDFRIGMAIMVGSLLVTLICALTGSAMNSIYHSNPIENPLNTIVKVCSYVFYIGLFFIIKSYIKRNKIPK